MMKRINIWNNYQAFGTCPAGSWPLVTSPYANWRIYKQLLEYEVRDKNWVYTI